MITSKSDAWKAILEELNINAHNFDDGPFYFSAVDIKNVTSSFGITNNSFTEPRVLCKQDSRESKPEIFKEKEVFILPVKNGKYALVNGDGYIDIPLIETEPILHRNRLSFPLETSLIGDSEMQHLDKAFAVGLIQEFMQDQSLVLTIRGRKYTPGFDFNVGGQSLHVESVQTEVDAGYEGESEIVLIEAKNGKTQNTVIRQLYYPYRQWQESTSKPVKTLFFEHDAQVDLYNFWEFRFSDPNEYNSIELVKAARYKVVD